jgi:hypothetical protein
MASAFFESESEERVRNLQPAASTWKKKRHIRHVEETTMRQRVGPVLAITIKGDGSSTSCEVSKHPLREHTNVVELSWCRSMKTSTKEEKDDKLSAHLIICLVIIRPATWNNNGSATYWSIILLLAIIFRSNISSQNNNNLCVSAQVAERMRFSSRR